MSALVDTPEAWRAFADRLAGVTELGFDLEADGFHRYPERTALLQVALPDASIHLLDPLALTDLAALGRALADPAVAVVLHSGAYDVRALDRDLGFRLRGLVDTSIAAQFCGLARTGLANVLAEILGLDLPKSRQLQRMDWSRRPLPPEALDYAAGDVAHLLSLRRALEARLAELGRAAWADEECRRLEQVRHVPPEPPEQACLGLRGARELTDAGRAMLRALYVWREGEALRIGRPPYRVMSNEALLQLAERPDIPLETLPGLGRSTLARAGRGLRAALEQGRQAEPLPWPRRGGPNPWTPEARARLQRLKAWRSAEAEAIGLDAGLLWPAAHLDQLALHPEARPETLDLGDPPWVRRWQWALLGERLTAFLGSRPG